MGLGHTMSCCSVGTNSLIFSCRYHCRSADSPGETISSGNSPGSGHYDRNLRRLMVCSHSSFWLFTFTFPGKLFSNVKWCICVMPLRAVFMVLSSKYSLQLNIWTIVAPSWLPSNCAKLGLAE